MIKTYPEIVNYFELIIIVSWDEGNYDVNTKNYIHWHVENVEAVCILLREGKGVRSNCAGYKNESKKLIWIRFLQSN